MDKVLIHLNKEYKHIMKTVIFIYLLFLYLRQQQEEISWKYILLK